MNVDPDGHAPKWLQIARWIGLGVGVLLCGTAIGILAAGVSTATSAKLNNNFSAHGSEFNGLYSNSADYSKGAKYVIRNGQRVSYTYKGHETIGYIKFFGSSGHANYAFVGMNGTKAATFGVRSVSNLIEGLGLTIFGI